MKLMEELQDCKYKYLFYLSVPMIDGNDGERVPRYCGKISSYFFSGGGSHVP